MKMDRVIIASIIAMQAIAVTIVIKATIVITATTATIAIIVIIVIQAIAVTAVTAVIPVTIVIQTIIITETIITIITIVTIPIISTTTIISIMLLISLTFLPLMIGSSELFIVAAIVLLLFGGKKIPELMRSMGQGVRYFKKGMNEEISGDRLNSSSENDVQLPVEDKK